jgi:hypothetical protein
MLIATKDVLTYLLTELSLLEKPPIVQPLKNFPAFYGTRRFITVNGNNDLSQVTDCNSQKNLVSLLGRI